jgi:hypothetical protein
MTSGNDSWDGRDRPKMKGLWATTEVPFGFARAISEGR